MHGIYNRTVNVLTGKKSKFTSPMNLIIGFILSLFFSFITYLYFEKKYKKKENNPIIPSIIVGLFTMLMYNMLTRPIGITF
jgi:multisubunit Na+/H+ antiporter MnhE subunit|tara:strand:+ start:210 stop:452 length:243 start_codon:yes stop_codon:yes gene_type:complete